MKKKTKVFLGSCILSLLFFLGIVTPVKAEDSRGVSDETGKIIIPVEKKWEEDVADEDKPESVTIKLYKYLDTPDPNATPIKTITLTSDGDWKGEFDISDEKIYHENSNKTYHFKIEEDPITGFSEVKSEHVDPNVVFTPPSLDHDWQRITPCSELDITSSGDFKLTVIVKKGGNYIVWTLDALTESERKMMIESTKRINGMHGAHDSEFIFISGLGGSHSGVTVTQDQIKFDKPSTFSMFATGFYYKSSTETNSCSVTNGLLKTNLTVEKDWKDHNNILGLRPQNIEVQLYNGQTPIGEPKILSASNEWKYEYVGLKEFIDGVQASYSIKEVNSGVYTATYNVSGNVTTITNTYEVQPTTIKVNKVWKNTEDFISTYPGVVVSLCYRVDEKDQNCKQLASTTLNESNNWTYIFKNGQDGQKVFDILPSNYIYEVRETGYSNLREEDKLFFQEFIKTTTTHNGNNWTITNTCTASYDLPQTGSSGALFLTLSISTLLGVPAIYGMYSAMKKMLKKRNL